MDKAEQKLRKALRMYCYKTESIYKAIKYFKENEPEHIKKYLSDQEPEAYDPPSKWHEIIDMFDEELGKLIEAKTIEDIKEHYPDLVEWFGRPADFLADKIIRFENGDDYLG